MVFWFDTAKNVKSVENSNDIAYQIMRRNDNTLEIPKAILELKHMFIICLSYAHNMVIIYFNDKSLRNKYIAFFVFWNIMICLSYPTDKHLLHYIDKLTVLKVNNKNSRTMSCSIYF